MEFNADVYLSEAGCLGIVDEEQELLVGEGGLKTGSRPTALEVDLGIENAAEESGIESVENVFSSGAISPLLQSEYTKLQREHLLSVKFSKSEKKYLTQYLLYMDRKNRVKIEEVYDVVDIVWQCVRMIGQKLQEKEFRDGEIVECGSFFENAKVGDPHEFDFQYIMPLENYRAEVAKMNKFKDRKSNLESKTFFKLYKCDSDEEIVAKERHDAFKAAVEAILTEASGTDEQIMTKKAGPAVKFVLKIPYNYKGKVDPRRSPRHVKIDLTMAYTASTNHEFFDQVELRTYANFLRNEEQLLCHFIPAHDFWKLSFTKNETELMKKVAAVNYKGVCYRAIKILRDAVDVRDTLGDGILSSYPIKVTHMKRTLHTHLQGRDEVNWTKDRVGENVINIARAVDVDGTKEKMLGIFIRNDNIMGESDKSYMESRRILNELKNISTGFKQYAFVNRIIWLVLMLASAGLIVAEGVAWANTDWRSLLRICGNNTSIRRHLEPPFPLDLPFLFIFSILVWIALLANFAGLGLVCIVTKKWDKDIFRVLPNLRRYIFTINVIASLILAGFDIILIVHYVGRRSCRLFGSRQTNDIVAGMTMFITFIPFILLFISGVNTLAYGREQSGQACVDGILFFEFPFCRERTERIKDEEKSSLYVVGCRHMESLTTSDIHSTVRINPLDTFGDCLDDMDVC